MASEKITKILEDIKTLSVTELFDLEKAIEDEFGVSAAIAVAAPAAGAGAVVEEEQTEFSVVLKSFGESKMNVIKAVKDACGLGLKEAKDLVDAAPKNIKEAVGKEEAEEIQKKVEEQGAKVTLK